MRLFRKATAEDASAIEKLYRALVPGAPISVLPDRITHISNDPNTYLIVCDDDGDVIATALLTLCADVMFNHQPFAVLENIIIDADFQRQGVGKSLMDYLEVFCREKDCSKIMLLSSVERRGAHDFFAAMGYDPDGKLGFIKYRKYFGS